MHPLTTLVKFLWGKLPRRLRGNLSDLFSVEKVWIHSFDTADRSPSEAVRRDDRLQLSEAGPEVVPQLVADPEFDAMTPEAGEELLGALEANCRLLIGRWGDSIVFYGLVSLKRKRFWTKYIRLRDDEFFMMKYFTKPSYRRRGIYTRAIRFAVDEYGKRGYRKGYDDVPTHLPPSMRGNAAAGGVRTDSYCWHIRLLKHDFVLPRGSLRRRFFLGSKIS